MKLPTNLRPKLHTNEPPTDEEVGILKRNIAGTLVQLHTLEAQLSPLHDTLKSLSLQQETIRLFLKGHRRLLSPFRRLHPEILQEIFFHCIPTAHNAVMSNREAPLLLGRVCRLWRQVSLTTPKLWNSIHISAEPIESPGSPGMAKCTSISSWLARSGVLPLFISMSVCGFWSSDYPSLPERWDHILSYIHIVLQHKHRWKNFYLSLPGYDCGDLFGKFDGADFPLLETLTIDCYQTRGDNSVTQRKARILGVFSSPRLCMLTPPPLVDLLQVQLQWQNITGLNLRDHSLPLTQVMNILARCPKLEICDIFLPGKHDSDFHGPQALYLVVNNTRGIEKLTLPILRTLSVASNSALDDDVAISSLLFQNLSAPSLRHLLFEQSLNDVWSTHKSLGPKFIDAFDCFLRRLTRPLEELTIWTKPFSAQFALELLRFVPDLKRLSLKGYIKTLGIFRRAGVPLRIDLTQSLMDDALLTKFIPTPKSIPSLSDSFSEDDGLSYTDPRTLGDLHSPLLICPKLEVFDCSDALFSDRCILDFLRSRSVYRHKYRGITHLRRVSMTLSPYKLQLSELQNVSAVDMKEEVGNLEKKTGMLVCIQQQPSPYDSIHEPAVTVASPCYFGF